MAYLVTIITRHWIALPLLCICLIFSHFGNADEDIPQLGGIAGGGNPQLGGAGAGAGGNPQFGGAAAGTGGGNPQLGGEADPAQIVAKALLCFNDKYIYSSCEESYRLRESGDLHVPAEKTDVFCEGPCLSETNLVLGCIDNIFANFLFYNKATIQDIRDTIHAACGYGPQRGNFNVAEHIQAEESNAQKVAYHALLGGIGLILIIMGRGILL